VASPASARHLGRATRALDAIAATLPGSGRQRSALLVRKQPSRQDDFSQPRLCLSRDVRRGGGLSTTQFGVKCLGHIGDSRSHDGKQKPPIYGGFRSG
jgi:hypothetical protein